MVRSVAWDPVHVQTQEIADENTTFVVGYLQWKLILPEQNELAILQEFKPRLLFLSLKKGPKPFCSINYEVIYKD